MTIRIYPDPILATAVPEVTDFNEALEAHIAALWEALEDLQGYGLASNQVELPTGPFRVIIVRMPTDDPDKPDMTTLINPRIVDATGKERGQEASFSLPHTWGHIERATAITVEFRDAHGQHGRSKVIGQAARVVQHLIDQLDGITYIDRLGKLGRKTVLQRQAKKARIAAKVAEAKQASAAQTHTDDAEADPASEAALEARPPVSPTTAGTPHAGSGSQPG